MNSRIRRGILLVFLVFAVVFTMGSLVLAAGGGSSGGGDIPQISYSVDDVDFNMRLAPKGTIPTGMDDAGEATIEKEFWIAETPVTYELWYTVRMRAMDNGYVFANPGGEGSFGAVGESPSDRKLEPVTLINWFDSIVWCNALSEYFGYDPVYLHEDEVIRDSTNIVAGTRAKVAPTDGFRLPTVAEWELAARYQGSDSSYGAIEYPEGSGSYWTPGNYASGAKGHAWVGDLEEGTPGDKEINMAAAWYLDNSSDSTKPVGLKPEGGNALGLYDMSGNVWEWCFDAGLQGRIFKGGSWNWPISALQLGFNFDWDARSVFHNLGLRPVKNS